jgi:hypothetical protein
MWCNKTFVQSVKFVGSDKVIVKEEVERGEVKETKRILGRRFVLGYGLAGLGLIGMLRMTGKKAVGVSEKNILD